MLKGYLSKPEFIYEKGLKKFRERGEKSYKKTKDVNMEYKTWWDKEEIK